MKLSQYPEAIAQAVKAVNTLDQRIAELRQDIAYLEGKAELVVAFETALKNDNQRRARRFEILEASLDYRELQLKLLHLTTEKSNALAHVEFLRNQFSVAKLEARLSLADKLVGIEARELVEL
ncbi:hypothetical protein H6G89_27220 [Oscillatoria sp. FACHB-1407]|uniref:hypothetical protein n=1 Tax=Oscillatoria sp. FACHB-1407 TaxID=2692847 RepID=UPI00168438EF|nr:hypothetical protein [Oscillatoria sp. FACHB-1407]MBD2464700.1 hypothetical protein [Oscillatoria sp. FACHB-1407]